MLTEPACPESPTDFTGTSLSVPASRGRWWRHAGTILRQIRDLILIRCISLVGSIANPGQWPSGILQAWALRRMGVRCASSQIWIGPRTAIDNPRRLVLGQRVVIGADSRLTGFKADIVIGDDFLSAPGLQINTGTHDPATLEPRYAPVHIGHRVWCGMRVNICAGATIGSDAIVGAGSVVLSNIPGLHLSAGVPCKPIRSIAGQRRAARELWSNFRRPAA